MHTNKMAGWVITVAISSTLMVCGYLYMYKITAGKDPYDEGLIDASKEKKRSSMKDIISLETVALRYFASGMISLLIAPALLAMPFSSIKRPLQQLSPCLS
jgi:hypothetical protein